jgi:hypothetical protein
LTVYAESSAVLAWLLGERAGEAVRRALANAEVVVTSELTLVECDRVLIRAQMTHEINEAIASDRRAVLSSTSSHWHLLEIDQPVLERARRPFPSEPIRTLDALHLASALVARGAAPGLAMLSLDARMRATAHQLGLQVLPPRV